MGALHAALIGPGQFFVGATLNMYPGPKGDRQNYLGLGQVKAYDAINNKYKWEVMERFAAWGGTLATAGGVMFYGTLMASSRRATATPASCCGSSSCPPASSAIP